VVYNTANMLMPHFVKMHKERRHEGIVNSLHEEIRRLAAFSIPVFFGFLLIGKDVIILLYSSDYLESVPIFKIYLFLIPLELYAYNTILQAMGRTDLVFYLSIGSLAVNAVLSIALVKFIGINGAALATVIASLFSNAGCLFFIARFTNTSLAHLMPWGFLARLCLVSALLYLGFYYAKSLLPVHYGRIFPLGTAFVYWTLLGAVAWRLGFITPQDKARIRATVWSGVRRIRGYA
ncbi:MAG: hypothetical protein GF344_09530, partial [Chitinivibrionales bacterium]|nr:hypothetical protein [Chitinivibrionales bacterium]MBD3357082.1 hypothetical protein [Chitinivibrionales bacterium]